MRTTAHTTLAMLVISIGAFSGCDWIWGKQLKAGFCDEHPTDSECPPIDAGSDGPDSCSSSTQCEAPTAVCDLGAMTCVECTPAEAGACVGMMPVCGDDRACRACEAHSECASSACLPDGSCADPGVVAYVSPTGTDNASCSQAMPCTDVADALATGRAYVKISGTNDEGGTIAIDNQNVTILADPGAKIVRTSNGIVLEVKGTSRVTIYDLEISGGSGAQGIGISMPAGNTATLTLSRARISENAGGGIDTSGGTLTLSRSTVSGNAGGGISISGGQFDITNTFIVQNGGAGSTFGGIEIGNITGSGTRRLDFNTISANQAPATVNTGVSCGTVLTALVFANNIIYGNIVAGGGRQVGGSAMCSVIYSDVGPDMATGTGNINQDPQFIAPAQGNFHLASTSPAKDVADPAATLSFDVDGEARPQGAGRDMGADEIVP
ncbi:MAG: right-handed parallel beta-helix repeat-containing protein [Kofleriaceae bacterium]